MRRFGFILIGTLLLHFAGQAQTDTAWKKFWLVGDAGKLKQGTNPQINFIRNQFSLDKQTTVLFLGDNVYPVGLPDSQAGNFPEKRNILDQQLNLVKGTEAQAYIIPGNHDWLEGRKNGWNQLMNQYNYVRRLNLPNVHFQPEDGCPGPVELNIDARITLVIMDTQWWLMQNERPGAESDCDCKNEEEVLERLREIVYRNRGKLLLFAAHHPFKTNGPHGGYFTFRQHLFPLTDINDKLYLPFPVIGSIYPLLRGGFGHIQDLRHPVYQDMAAKLDTILTQHPYCIRLSGHEHTLQYIRQQGQEYIVSGAASKQSPVRRGKGTLFANSGPGVALLECGPMGQIRLRFFSGEAENPVLLDTNLRRFQPIDTAINQAVSSSFPDSVTTVAVPAFKAGSFKRLMWGANYRQEWTSPIRVPVFDLGKEKGGLVAVKQGGRLQSKSLRLEDKEGFQYVLRSIEKYPERILPAEFRKTFIKNALVDAISASYPYAAVSVPIIAAAAGVPHANPKIVFLPDDPRLGIYRSEFANKLYLFEEREPDRIPKTYSTPKLLEELDEDNDNQVDERAVLKARLLDMFIMDFDRHEDQWRWGRRTKGKGKEYFPIPRDRDQPFFINQGIIPKIISRNFLQPRFQGFAVKARDINSFNFNGRYFDRLFLSGLSREDWEKATDAFLPLMTDSVIEAAIRQQPAGIRDYSAEKIINTLKRRRAFFKAEILQYYDFLAREVDIYGSDKKDWFEVVRHSDGSVTVNVYKINQQGEKSLLLYSRQFQRGKTREIRLWGKGAGDHFETIGDDAGRSILVRIIGGPGKDAYVIQTRKTRAGLTRIYDLSQEKNRFAGTGRWRNKLDKNPEVNKVDPRTFKYNTLFPLLSVTYNLDDGLFLGASLKQTVHGFRKEPHKLQQQWKASYAFATGAYNFGYEFDATDLIGKADLVISARLKAPNNTNNFFGFGNETSFERITDKKIRYYRTRYNIIEGAALLRLNAWGDKLSILMGPVAQLFHIDSSHNKDRIITSGALPGVDAASIFRNKAYAGARVQLSIDMRNNQTITSRGLFWSTYFQLAKGLTGSSSNLTQLNTDLAVFTSFNKAAKLVLAGRIGGGINFRHYEFYQAQYLGGTDNLRGFRKYRFAGDRSLYMNLDARLHLVDFRGYLVPGALGILAFNDIGRVWWQDENSAVWHDGYGGGIWVAPAHRYILTFCYAHSKDGGLPFVSLGFQF